jgi:alkylation response protein AidB-like acyl-CoA dehydrogenase
VPGGHFYFRDDPAPLFAVSRASAPPSSSSPSASAADHPSRAAEASRAGFLGNLFAGRLRWDLISPFPRSPATGDAVVEEMTRAVRELVDPEEVERTGALPDGYVDALRARRLLNLGMQASAGGRGLSYFDVFRVVRAAMSWSLPAGYVVAVHNGIGAGAILDAIPEGATKEYVRTAVAAGALSGWADTEATGAGNRMPLTRARPSDDGEAYLLDGEKLYTVNASIANLLVVSATLPNDAGEDESRVFFVDTSTPGFRVTSLHELMGIRGLPMARMSFDGVRVPKDRLLAGDEGHWRLTSLLEPLSALGRMYIVVASSLATADRCVAWSRDFVGRRQVDGRPIASYEAIQRLAAGNAADAYAMETVACFCLAGIDAARLPLRWFEQVAAKNVASMICARVVDRTMSLFAAEGYETAASKRRRGGPPLAVERAYRDARAFRIAGGVEFLIDFAAARTAIFATHYASDTGAGAAAASTSETVVEGAQPAVGGRNQAHARFVCEAVERFGRTCRAMSERWPRASELFERQHTLALANQIANELFTMAAVLARCAEGDEHAKDLADVFCVDARHRVEDAFRRLAAADEGGPDWARVVDAWLSRGGREPPPR